MDARISIIIPVYNAEKHVGRCIESLISQQYKDYECICVNDGSTDNSAQILEHYSNTDSRIKVIHQKNSGVSAARNRGIKEAKGDYIVFVDSDDTISSVLLSSMIEVVQQDDCDIVATGYWDCDEKGTPVLYHRPFKEGIFPQQKQKVTSVHADQIKSSAWAKLYKKRIIDTYSLCFDEGSFYGEDLVFVFKYMLHARSISSVDEGLYYYYQTQGSCMDKVSGGDMPLSRYRSITKSFLRVYSFMRRSDILLPRYQRYALAFLRVAGSCKVVWLAARYRSGLYRAGALLLVAETILRSALNIPLGLMSKTIREVIRLRSIRRLYANKCIEVECLESR